MASVLLALAALAPAQTITVTSPNNGTFVTGSATVNFNLTGFTGANNRRIRTRTVALRGGTVIAQSDDSLVTPNTNGEGSGSNTVAFQTNIGGSQDGPITLRFTARFDGQSAVITTIDRTVTLDTQPPKFLEFSPIDGIFLRRGPTYNILALLDERNVQEWRVQVNGANLPNNTGSTRTINVPWNTGLVRFDGSQSVTIRARDRAEQDSNQTINVTLDSIAPTSQIVFPTAEKALNRNSIVTVTVDVSDASQQSTDVTGVDVTLTDTTGRFLHRVARTSFSGSSGNTNRWTGRIRREIMNSLPRRFVLRVSVRDKAGNQGVVQTAQLRIR